ncbi:hypothetical protein [Gallalistipes aquisgranensis]|nr:hypothetical protein [Gallalistipes aquisgranensis]
MKKRDCKETTISQLFRTLRSVYKIRITQKIHTI